MHRENGIAYRLMRDEDHLEVNEVIALGFTDEPMLKALNGDYEYRLRRWREFARHFTVNILNNCTIVAIDESTNQMVGVMLTRDLMLSLPPDFYEEFYVQSPDFTRLLDTLIYVDTEWMNQHPDVDHHETGRVMDLWLLSVIPSHQGRGISSHVARLAVEQIRARGYQYAVVECTGAFSYKVVQKLGFERKVLLDYQTWRGPVGKEEDLPIFRDVPPPHIGLQFCELPLR